MEIDQRYTEFEKEIDKMSLEELLYVRMAPQVFIYKKMEKEFKNSNQIIQEIENNNGSIKRNEQEIGKQNMQILNECEQLKNEINKTRENINQLIQQNKQTNKQPTKNEFINALDIEIKNSFKTPDSFFKEFLNNKINQKQFEQSMKELGTGKNYYYYKLLSDKLKEM